MTATNRASGIELNAASRNVVEHNDVSQAGTSGIGIKNVSDDNMFRDNDASGSNVGINYFATGSGNSYVDNDLSGTAQRGLVIRNDSEFVAMGNDFTGSQHGMWLGFMDDLELIAASTTFDIDVSSVDGIGLTLVEISGNSIVDGLDLSYINGGASGTGFELWNSDGVIVSNVTATNRSRGIQLIGASGNTVDHNNVSQSGGHGIHIIGVSNVNTISNNNASGSVIGIEYFGTGLANYFVDNNLSGATNWGLVVYRDEQFVATGNDFTDSVNGMLVKHMDGITLAPSATFDIDVSTVTGVGLRFHFVTNSTVDGLDLSYSGSTATGTGLNLFVNSDNNTVRNVTATNRNTGIQLNKADGNLIEQNNVSQAGDRGIDLEASNANVFRQNDASGSFVGIGAFPSLGNDYVDNDLSGTERWGLVIIGDAQFVATGNDFTSSGRGVYLANMDGITLTPSATFDIDVSNVTGTALNLVSITNSTVDGLDLSYTGSGASGMGLSLINSHVNTVRNVNVGNRDTRHFPDGI